MEKRLMIALTERIQISTRGKGTYQLTGELSALVSRSGIKEGLATVFIQHTSASLVIYENADPTARTDLHRFFEELVPEDNPALIHTMEGPDDSTSHLRMVLTRTSESIPIAEGRLQLGTWQGIFLFEHRTAPHRRTVVVSLLGS
jgi:secondary thiamine-phosphate synthase enzyme